MKLFNKLKRKLKKKNNEKINCPRCNIPMRQITRENITIDVCKECEGMWLDKGEINDLIKLNQKLAKKNSKED